MTVFGLLALLALFLATETQAIKRDAYPPGPQIPEQVHLAYPGDPTQMVVSYVTMDVCDRGDEGDPECSPQGTPTSTCQYGFDETNLVFSTSGTQKTFQDGGNEKREFSIHTIKLTNLKPGVKYYYRVGDETYGWSPLFHFRTMNSDFSPVRIGLFGDLGDWNGQQSIPRLETEVLKEKLDAIIHVGDFAYDLDTDNGRSGDRFMNDIQPIAAYVPYQVCPGNHEEKYNFSHYSARFWMPDGNGDSNPLFSTFSIARAHFISISTELYFFQDQSHYDLSILKEQYNWLESELQKANAPEFRKKFPWLIVYGHRPMYTSMEDQRGDAVTLIEGFAVNGSRLYGLENLFLKYGVDIYFSGHVHAYERAFPVKGGWDKPSISKGYINPEYPVHIVSGSAGCVEKLGIFDQVLPWSAVQSSTYGYGILSIQNSTHIQWEQILDTDGSVLDSVWIIKN